LSRSADARGYVVDTSALLAYLKGEAGADVVERLLADPEGVYVSLISLMEVRYLYLREAGQQATDEAFILLSQIGLEELEVTRSVLEEAASIKSRVHLSVADAIIAATAKLKGATLIHRDPEFDALKDEMNLMSLPKKTATK